MVDNGIQLKSIGIQLQTFCSQIQNMAFQLTNINPNLGLEMQNVGFQISNLANQIFNIGIAISNMLNNIQNFGNMPNYINNINIENGNEFLRMNNNLMNEYNNNSNENEKINIKFIKNGSNIATVYISYEQTFKDLLVSFIKKAKLNPDYLDKNYFLFNGQRIFPDDKIKIKDSKLMNLSWINIIDKGLK